MGRLIAWLTGCRTGTHRRLVRAYGRRCLASMAEHMTLNMFIPVLLKPYLVTLALRVLPVTGDGRPPGLANG